MLTAIAGTAARLCDAKDALIYLVDGDQFRLAAKHGPPRDPRMVGYTLRISRGGPGGRAVLERRTVHVRDLAVAARTRFPDTRAWQETLGWRTVLATPLLHNGSGIGAILILRTKVRPFTAKQVALLKTFADQAAIAIENARLSQEVAARNRDLTEAFDQQTATRGILRVVSSSPTDVQPVFDAIADSAARLCEADDAEIYRVDGEVYRRVAHRGPVPIAGPLGEAYAISRGRPSSRAIIDRQTIHVHDQAAEIDTEFPDLKAWREVAGVRTILAAPLLREGVAIGVIVIRRTEVKPFTDKQIALLQTFADQAVIAIENVRLFKELQARNRELTEALEQQTATSEILGVISSSPIDVQPVFDTIVRSASRLCDGQYTIVTRLEGEMLHLAAQWNSGGAAEALERAFPMRLTRAVTSARAVLDRALVHIPDAERDPELSPDLVQAVGRRSFLAVPMLRDGHPIGAIGVSKAVAEPFSDKQIELLRTFAAQAVLAIENVRLFKELEARNRDLTEALEQQTATGEILRVISSSPTDVQPTFEAIAASATRLCAAVNSLVIRFDGRLMHLAAHHNLAPERLDALNRVFPLPPSRGSLSGRAIVTGTVAQVADISTDPEYALPAQTMVGYRSVAAVPMLREGVPIGAIVAARDQVAPFSEKQVELLKIFADQAVIAIENVRLFKELESRNAELTETLARQTATGEVLRAISRAQTDAQPVFDIIAASARRLCGAGYGQVQLHDGELIHLAALENVNPEGAEAIRRAYPLRVGEGNLGGRVIRTRGVVQIPDLLVDRAYAYKSTWEASGLRSLL
ncbi:MAG: histidine kinase, partial [Candidatus Rokuibacteriota bacterium]